MPGYAIPEGRDTVGMCFSKVIVKDLLRTRHRYDGIVITDFLKDMPWGVEHLPEKDRHRLIVEAECDQIGGENDPQYLIQLMKEGTVSLERINASIRRILTPMFKLGLFENPYVDPAEAKRIVKNPDFVRAGNAAQRKSIVLLKNEPRTLPLKPGSKIYIEGFKPEVAQDYGTVVTDPADADTVVIRVFAPFAYHKYPEGEAPTGWIAELFAKRLHEGTLAYEGAENSGELAAIKRLVGSGKPVVVCMYMDRPAVLSEFLSTVPALLADFSSDDAAILDIVFGRAAPSGKLPFDLPRNMASVLNQCSDVSHDFEDPLFRSGHGLNYHE